MAKTDILKEKHFYFFFVIELPFKTNYLENNRVS